MAQRRTPAPRVRSIPRTWLSTPVAGVGALALGAGLLAGA